MVVQRDSVRLALIAALQHLSPRQRAVLVLRDVLQWKAAEVAEALDTTTTAVNSVLQRARAQISNIAPTEDTLIEPSSGEARTLLREYVRSFESYDVDAIVALFTRDAVWEMPPFEGWYRGPEAIGQLIGDKCPADGPGAMRDVPTSANGHSAFGLYMRQEDGIHHAFQAACSRRHRVGDIACDLLLRSQPVPQVRSTSRAVINQGLHAKPAHNP